MPKTHNHILFQSQKLHTHEYFKNILYNTNYVLLVVDSAPSSQNYFKKQKQSKLISTTFGHVER
jgi:hypothetical protein